MKQLLLFWLGMAFSFISFPQTDSAKLWTLTGEGLGTFSNTGFGNYWSQGGDANTSFNALLNISAHQKKEYLAWDNNLKIEYGQSKTGTDADFKKSSDIIDLISKVGIPMKKSPQWFYSALFNFKSQITPTNDSLFNDLGSGVHHQLSKFFGPADVGLGVGIDFKPNDNFSVFLSPLTGKLRFILDDNIASSGVYGNDVILVAPTDVIYKQFKKTKPELGPALVAQYGSNFLEDNISVSSKLELASDYLTKPLNADVVWGTLTTFNPWKFIVVSYSTDLRYDDDIKLTTLANGERVENGDLNYAKGIQFRNLLGIGVTLKLFNDKE